MTLRLQQLIEEAQELSPQEQIELISAVSQFLHEDNQHVFLTTDFWQPKAIEQIVQAQAVQPVQDIAQLAFDEDSDDESADDMVAYMYGQRKADRLRVP